MPNPRCPKCHGTMRSEREVYGRRQALAVVWRCLCGKDITTAVPVTRTKRPSAYHSQKSAVTDANLHVLSALGRVIMRDGRATVRSIADEAGITTQPTHYHLETLKRFGLVTWERGRAGTIRPEVRS